MNSNNNDKINEQGNYKKRKLIDEKKEIKNNLNYDNTIINGNDILSKELENKILENYSFYSIVQQLQLQSIGFEIPIEYTRFMILKLKYKDYISDNEKENDDNGTMLNKLIPSQLIMLFWKTHYQLKDKYKEFSSLLGKFIKYTPISNSISKEEKRIRYLNTLSLYYKEFLIKPMILDFKIWPLDQYASKEEINNFNYQIEKKLEKRRKKKQLQKQL